VTAAPLNERAFSVRVDEESRFFLGHFPEDPILPGIALLALVMEAVATWEQHGVTLLGLRDFRLRRVVRPGDGIDIHLSRTVTAGEVRFAVKSGTAVSSSGILMVASTPPPA
jgi:3-hydroxymyristoyl/3-hydroxydecanoyl-(acyl carrier protein) dehydratase